VIMRWIIWMCGSVLLAAILWGEHRAQAVQPGVIGEQFVFEEAPFAECHASTVVETPEGLLCAWFGGTREGHDDVGIWLSRCGSEGWSKPVEVADGAVSDSTRYPCWNPVLFAPLKGPVMLFYKVGPSPSRWWGMVMRSDDHGRTWSAPQQLPEGILGPIKNKPIQLPDGTILSGSSTEHDGWRVHFERSRDGGQTWQQIAPADDGRRFGLIQPTLLRHADGRLRALLRSRSGRIVEMTSVDGGITWSQPVETGLPNPNAGLDAVTLDDGRFLLVYNHTTRGGNRPRGREMLNVAVSEDGQTWQAGLILENTAGQEYSYPAVIQAGNGQVHITYTWRRQRIRHVVIDPSRLSLRPIQEGRWPQ
jgi:predicted neuraminidase